MSVHKHDNYVDWYARSIAGLPALEARIVALSKRFYCGCGFHYGKIEELAYLKVELARIDPATVESWEQIIHSVRLEGLYQDVDFAERSADDLERGGSGYVERPKMSDRRREKRHRKFERKMEAAIG